MGQSEASKLCGFRCPGKVGVCGKGSRILGGKIEWPGRVFGNQQARTEHWTLSSQYLAMYSIQEQVLGEHLLSEAFC